MDEIIVTPEEIVQHYLAAMDSVNLIAELKAKPELKEWEVERLQANVDHLKIMLAKDFWTTEDLTPFHNAIGA